MVLTESFTTTSMDLSGFDPTNADPFEARTHEIDYAFKNLSLSKRKHGTIMNNPVVDKNHEFPNHFLTISGT